jgi:hypothetical protein
MEVSPLQGTLIIVPLVAVVITVPVAMAKIL